MCTFGFILDIFNNILDQHDCGKLPDYAVKSSKFELKIGIWQKSSVNHVVPQIPSILSEYLGHYLGNLLDWIELCKFGHIDLLKL